jgi:hypothetical protein
MRMFVIALAVAAIAGATYVAAAPGGEASGPTAAQFKALQMKVARLQREGKKERKLLSACMRFSIPIDRFGDYTNDPSTYGFTYADPNVNGGTPFPRTALDKTVNDDPKALWITGGTYACHQHLPGALRKPRTASR